MFNPTKLPAHTARERRPEVMFRHQLVDAHTVAEVGHEPAALLAGRHRPHEARVAGRGFSASIATTPLDVLQSAAETPPS